MSHFKLYDSVHFFIDELRARVVAESGIPSDRFHLGKLVLRSFIDTPDFIAQIDGGTGEKETCRSLLKRSIKCANYFKSLGLKKRDIISLMAPNHLDLAVPFYAALYLGIIIAPFNETESVADLSHNFEVLKPKLIISQNARSADILEAVKNTQIDIITLTFDTGSHKVLSEEIRHYDDDVENFRVEDFDPEETLAFLLTTSGTTGASKFVCNTHKNFATSAHYYWNNFNTFPLPNPMHLLLSPLRWLTGNFFFLMTPILRITRLQTSKPLTAEHGYELINKYKPASLLLSTPLMNILAKSEGHKQCDFSCFESIRLVGSNVPETHIREVQALAPNALVTNSYGMTECSGVATSWDDSPLSSCGKPARFFNVKLVDVDTRQEITEPNKPGELLLKSPSICKGYYKASDDLFTEDGWMKSGDVLYRDEHWNMFYVERLKLYIKYYGTKISPITVENVIIQHPGVMEVTVIGFPDPVAQELVTAFVVRKSGSTVTAQEIKDIVKESLPDSHQLRGGVVFLDKMPMNFSNKIDRRKLKQTVKEMPRE